MIAGNIYESLLRYDEKLNPQPSLAKSWEISADQTVYTFKLQEGVKWHDGKPFTADDVVFSLDKFLRDVHPRWRPIVTNQVEVDREGRRHDHPDDPEAALRPASSCRRRSPPPRSCRSTSTRAPITGRTRPTTTPIGTGPMKFKEWKKGSYVHLVRNEDYWHKGKPLLDEIYFQIIPDAAARAVAYETGKVDVLTGGSVEIFDVARLSKLPNTCVTTKGWEMFAPHAWITPNVRTASSATSSSARRMMYAIDREFVKDVVWSGYGKIPTGPISSKTKFYSADVPTYTFDQKKAKELIKASGYKGEPIKLLGLPYGETWTPLGRGDQAELRRGRHQDRDRDHRRRRLDADAPANCDFDLTFNFLYQFGDPATGVARSYVSSNIVKGNPFGNVGGYSNPEVDRLFAEARQRPGREAPGALHQGAEDPGRRAAGALAPRARLPDRLPLQRQGPRHDRHRHQRRLPRTPGSSDGCDRASSDDAACRPLLDARRRSGIQCAASCCDGASAARARRRAFDEHRDEPPLSSRASSRASSSSSLIAISTSC